MKQGSVVANGLKFSYLERGEGPLILLLHGYPDNAWSWEFQIPVLADAGYRVVAPFLRGYPPTQIPKDSYFDRVTLAMDVRELIYALNGGQACYLVAQDWGAALSYGFLAMFPELVKRAVLMAIPHPIAVFASLGSPEQIHRAFHWWFFQLPNLPEQVVPANSFAFIDYLWNYWSPDHHDADHVNRIKAMLAEPGAVAATIGYYRAAFNPAYQNPSHSALKPQLDNPITVPTLALCGADDVRAAPMSAQAHLFNGEYRFQVVPGSGHFLHREKPNAINSLVLDWLKKS